MQPKQLHIIGFLILSLIPVAVLLWFLQADLSQVGSSLIMLGISVVAFSIVASIFFAIKYFTVPKKTVSEFGLLGHFFELAKISLPTVRQPFIESNLNGVKIRFNFEPEPIGLNSSASEGDISLNLQSPISLQASIEGLTETKVKSIESKWQGWISRFGGTVSKDSRWITWKFPEVQGDLPAKEQVNHLLDCF